MTELEQLREKYEALGQQIERMAKAEQDPWDGVKEYWGWELLSNAPHVAEIKGAWHERRLLNRRKRGEAFLTAEACQHDNDIKVAQTKVANRIAEINREEGWEFVLGAEYYLFCYNAAEYQRCYRAERLHKWVLDAPERRGCLRAIETVIAEMPDALDLIYGVEK